jgi:hypothetical protein
MSKRVWGAALALGMGWVAASGPVSLAKPPDLPVHPQVTCPDGRVTPGTTGDHSEAAAPERTVEAIPDLTWLNMMVPEMVTRTLRAGGLLPAAAGTAAVEALSPLKVDREQHIERYRQARRIFLLGMEYEQKGDVSKARVCFQEAHLLSPETRYGRMAMERLSRLENQVRDGRGAEEAEEREKPNPRGAGQTPSQQYEEMLRRTMPLGTVPMDSY